MLRRLLRHLLIALLCGFAVFLILIVAAWYNLRGEWNMCRNQDQTRLYGLRSLRTQIVDYHEAHGVLPADLAEIPGAKAMLQQPGEPLLDSWGNPFQYRRQGETFELFSYGRDGQLGGIGLNADLYHDQRNRKLARPTFQQFFLTNDESEVARNSFLSAGLMAGCLVVFFTLLSLRDTSKAGDKMTAGRYIWFALVVIVISSVVGVFLLPVHIPNGH
ncbi:type II secretion system protein GspG [Gimesia algae]|uniref:Bacterial type II secretion system protein G n=1 Tax=Gimesia algae TaxID=2527971 RepID=A0A517V9D8_9PLAN|nr:type II secretion system protein GspG [Gimesia algae]QDT89603.1 Bacterial type II secretion system protein G [Gimesia algae]